MSIWSLRSLATWTTLVLIVAAGIQRERPRTEPYAPYHSKCDVATLLRPATSLSDDELCYVARRKAKADNALTKWLERTWDSNASMTAHRLPTVALSLSGGGPKAGLLAAGAIQGLDSRDSSYSVSGLLQGMTYISGLSGGSITLAGVMGNNFASISTLRRNLYNSSYQDLGALALKNHVNIKRDIAAKSAAGYPTTLVDIYGRLIAYDFIGGCDGANGLKWSSVMTQPEFAAYHVPYPIITLTNADVKDGQCLPSETGVIWEFSPFEFGSWQSDVQAFVQTRYLGTSLISGALDPKSSCTEGFDNLGFFTGISADILVGSGSLTCNLQATSNTSMAKLADEFLSIASPSLNNSVYGVVPNPFLDYTPSIGVRDRTALYMLDGGLSGQGIPIFPFLQHQRDVDVIFVADDESITMNNTTDGAALYATYLAAQRAGLSRMPPVPTNRNYTVEKLVSRPSFFGCYNESLATIIYMPDTTATLDTANTFSFTPSEIATNIQAGTDLVTQPDDAEWALCVSCAVMHKSTADLPSGCTACLERYCWYVSQRL